MSDTVAVPVDNIVISGLRKSYRSGSEELLILDDIDLTIAEASRVVITGESGSGKSTFLGLLASLEKPDAGSIVVRGVNIAAESERHLVSYRNRSVGLVFQFHYLLKEFSALENIMVPAMLAGTKWGEAKARAEVLLDEVGLSARASHYPSELSGGERQRVAVARALANSPALVLADEPTGNLDEKNALVVQELLFGLAERHRTTLVVVTHALGMVKLATHHLQLSQGRFSRVAATTEGNA